MIVLSFVAFLLLMTGVGVYSSKKSRSTTDDYILAGRSIGPIPVALSAVSTCHSGFMFIGMIGFTYQNGISSIWLILAWLIGDISSWLFIHKPLREKTESLNVHTFSEFISSGFSKNQKRLIQIISASFILLFLSVYAAAQLTAGSKALSVMLNWPNTVGILVGAVIVVAYSISGGIRASIWTDVIQSLIMAVSMLGLFLTALYQVGGVDALFSKLTTIDPNLVALIPNRSLSEFLLYFLGWIAFGFGVIGQPHIMTRPIAISNSEDLKTSRNIYVLWYLIFSLASLGVGLASRILLPNLASSDAELALPILATELLPSIFVGSILAGLFSSTISTADSQILTCSSAITQDLNPKWKQSLFASKFATLMTMLVIVGIALLGSNSVYALVVIGWSGLAVVLSPIIFCKCLNIRLTHHAVLASMIGGFISMLLWRNVFHLSVYVNEVLAGFIASTIIIFIIKKWRNFKWKQSR